MLPHNEIYLYATFFLIPRWSHNENIALALVTSSSNIRPTHCLPRYSALQIPPLFASFSAFISFFLSFLRACRMKRWNGKNMRSFAVLEESFLLLWTSVHQWTSEMGSEVFSVMQSERCIREGTQWTGHVRSQFVGGTFREGLVCKMFGICNHLQYFISCIVGRMCKAITEYSR